MLSYKEIKVGINENGWNLWLNCPVVKVWQAVALSLDIDPSNYSYDILSRYTRFNPRAHELFNRRMKIVTSHIQANNLLLHNRGLGWGYVEYHYRNIDLRVFAKWIKSLSPSLAKVPEKLLSLSPDILPLPKPGRPSRVSNEHKEIFEDHLEKVYGDRKKLSDNLETVVEKVKSSIAAGGIEQEDILPKSTKLKQWARDWFDKMNIDRKHKGGRSREVLITS